ncbi:universal stress protein UspA [Halalkaliarchaeum desulfuricum]|uniref:Universal stress protein UspA n=1 Tax=Halalkaliarchaeum desulfuricum TaxID=2055893 RepID=A0A343TIE9_9EURY|nr:universal stress protein [Halalkaliarchaeum desulfuricum]AUX08871.1 universal stress protein UspA [Halalkaliarchaeum desulfuricum]
MIERILLPTDGSEAAESAVERAYELADKFDAELHTMYVIEIEALPTFANLDTEPVREAHKRRGDELLTEIEENAPAGVNVTKAIEEGHPESHIVDYAEEHDIDVITMGTHGREGLGRVLIGSVTERVMRESPCSVLVTPVEET